MTSLTIKMSKQTSLGQFLKSTTNERAVPSASAEGSKRQAPEELGQVLAKIARRGFKPE